MDAVSTTLGAWAGWAALAVAGWLTVGLAVAWLERAGGATARATAAVLRLYPGLVRAGLRAAVTAALGAGLGAGVLDGGTALAADHRPRPPVVAPALPAVEPLDWPLAAPPVAVVPHQQRTPAPPDGLTAARVLVRPGDCLWSIAADALGRDASAAAVAAAWPRWWAANRDLVGPDPDQLEPGLRLRVPTSERNTP